MSGDEDLRYFFSYLFDNLLQVEGVPPSSEDATLLDKVARLGAFRGNILPLQVAAPDAEPGSLKSEARSMPESFFEDEFIKLVPDPLKATVRQSVSHVFAATDGCA